MSPNSILLYKFLFILLFLFFVNELYSQKINLKNIEGRCELSRHITVDQAEKKALQEAKYEALRKAGVSENVWSVFGLITENDGNQFSEIYSEMSVWAIGGLVNVKKVTYLQIEDQVDKKRYVTATIDAEVKDAEKVDKSYVLDVENVQSVYNDGDILCLSTQVFGANSYIKIFWFDSGGGSLIYPNDYEPSNVFEKEKTYKFPRNTMIDYVVEKKDKSLDMERINLMIVATKKNYPFLEDNVSFESLLKWIYNIPAADRTSYYQLLLVK